MRCCPTDILALVFLTGGIAAGTAGLGIAEPTTAMIFTLAWVSSAVIRLTDFRQGRRPAVNIARLNLRQAAIVILGAAPWLLMQLLQGSYAAAALWTPVDLGVPLRVVGVALGLAVVVTPLAAPFLVRWFAPFDQSTPAPIFAGDPRLSGNAALRGAALLLLTGSPAFAALCLLWVAVVLWIVAADATAQHLTTPTAAPPATHPQPSY